MGDGTGSTHHHPTPTLDYAVVTRMPYRSASSILYRATHESLLAQCSLLNAHCSNCQVIATLLINVRHLGTIRGATIPRNTFQHEMQICEYRRSLSKKSLSFSHLIAMKWFFAHRIVFLCVRSS